MWQAGKPALLIPRYLMQLYAQRTFSQKFNVVFDWTRQNWRPLLKSVTFFLLPVSLLQPLGMVTMFSRLVGLTENEGVGQLLKALGVGNILLFLLSLVLALVGAILSQSLFFAQVKATFIQHEDLSTFSMRRMWQAMRACMGRVCVLTVATIVAVLAVAGLFVAFAVSFGSVVGEGIGMLVFLLLCLLFFILLPVYPAYMLTDDGFFTAVHRGCRLGWHTWWGVFSTTMVMGFLAGTLQGFTSAPFQIIQMMQAALVGQISSAGATTLQFMAYLSGVVMCFIQYLTPALMVLMLCVHYGHAVDKVEGYTVDREIDDFENL